MQNSPLRKKIPYFFGLLFCILCLAASLGLYLYDWGLSDDELLIAAESAIQDDLNACAARYDTSLHYKPNASDFCTTCELLYDDSGKLVSWSNNEFLPPKNRIDRISKIHRDEDFLLTPGKTYLQIMSQEEKFTRVVLVPVYIEYKVSSNFLIPYVFLGRYSDLFSEKDRSEEIRPNENIREKFIRLESPKNGSFLTGLKGLPIERFREPVRKAVLLLFAIGLIGLLILIRSYTMAYWRPRYWSDALLLILLPGIRLLFWLINVPGDYVEYPLFSPELLAFNDILAPSLGDLTFNILTFFFVVWILYKNLFRYLNLAYRRLFKTLNLKWSIAALNLVMSCLLIKLYFEIFKTIIDNSTIAIEFTNIFKTDLYSYVILMDMGLLLVSFIFAIILLLRFNALLGERLNNKYGFISFQVGILLAVNVLLHLPEFAPAMVASFSLGAILLMIYRLPQARIAQFDLPNFLILLAVGASLSAFSLLDGLDSRNRHFLTKIADKVLEDRREKANTGCTKAGYSIDKPNEQTAIRLKFQELDGVGEFVDWFQIEYLDDNFGVFERRLAAYDQHGNRVDNNLEFQSQFNPFSTPDEESIIIPDKLYRIPSQSDRFIDAFMAIFRFEIDTSLQLTFLLELSSNPYGLGSISPIVLVNSTTYQEEESFSSYDYAIYIGNKLYATNGHGTFGVNLTGSLVKEEPFFHKEDDYVEYVKSVSDGRPGVSRTIVVRYPRQAISEVFTTFSLVFYFFGFAMLVFMVFPAFFAGLVEKGFSIGALPIRTKIRGALVLVSIAPILGIILFLYPFIDNRFNEQARAEIIEETRRIAKLVQKDLQQIEGRVEWSVITHSVENALAELGQTVPYDVNIFDHEGRLISSTELALYQSDILSGLMNADAHTDLRYGFFSNLVLEENIGNLSFLAGYQPVVGRGKRPIAFINVPFLKKKKELNEEVFGLLAYLANIYLLAFLLVGLIAVLVSNAITKPLSLIQQRLSTTTFGNVNQPINYDSNDEIGAIVSAYNGMLDKLSASEQRLKATQRELAWKQMARQVAHEIKNPLTPMRLGIQHLTRSWETQAPNLAKMFPKVMKTLLSQIDSLVNIANSFSQFARMPEPVKAQLSLNEIMNNVADLYSQTEGVNFDIKIPKEEFPIYADKDQLSRALGNIIKNGIQAMDMDEGGDMRINMKTNGGTAYIEIADTGRGMSEEIKKRVFEPNFSTKTSGMGLGLAIVRRIIETSGGDITFQSEEGVGTTFFIELPSAESTKDARGPRRILNGAET